MSLIAFHKFLISTAIVFCFGFALRQLSEFRATGDGWTLFTAIAFGVAVVALGFYLRHLQRFLKIRTEHTRFGSTLRSDPKGFVETYLRPAEPTETETVDALHVGNGRNRLLRWARSLIKPPMPSSKGNGHDGSEPN